MTNNEEIGKHFKEIIRLCKIAGIIGKNMHIGEYYVNFGFRKIKIDMETRLIKIIKEKADKASPEELQESLEIVEAKLKQLNDASLGKGEVKG